MINWVFFRGTYEIQPRAHLGRTTLMGPPMTVIIQANPDKPTAINVSCVKTGAPVKAGCTMLGGFSTILIV